MRAAYRVFPAPTVVCFLAVAPEVAQRRVLARGIDTEELTHLRALDAAYRALPEFGGFVVVPGDGDPTRWPPRWTGRSGRWSADRPRRADTATGSGATATGQEGAPALPNALSRGPSLRLSRGRG